jgi:hypothetical protein
MRGKRLLRKSRRYVFFGDDSDEISTSILCFTANHQFFLRTKKKTKTKQPSNPKKTKSKVSGGKQPSNPKKKARRQES